MEGMQGTLGAMIQTGSMETVATATAVWNRVGNASEEQEHHQTNALRFAEKAITLEPLLVMMETC
jgi:hypothetical protein